MAVSVHITGGKGFLGNYIARSLGAADVEVSDVDTLDVCDLAAVTERLMASRPAVVCHLAGLTGANASLADPRRFFEVNTTGTLNVLEACRRAEVAGFVFMSSLTVHGQTTAPVTEDSAFAPRHPYAGSKAAAELAVRTYAQCYDLRCAIVRPTLIAGEGQKEGNAMSDFVAAALRDETIELFGDGSHEREWLHPEDVGDCVRAAIESVAAADGPGYEAYLVSSSQPVSMAALAQKAIDAVGKGKLAFLPSTRQAFSLTTASDKARRLLGWQPRLSFDDILARVVEMTQRGDTV